MGNNIAVKISADVVDLVAKRAVMSAELKAATKDLNDFAKEAKSAGGSDALRAKMLESADAVATVKAQISALDSEMKAATATAGKFEQQQVTSVGITGQQRVGFQQLAYNINDVSTMYAMGSKASQIFASQSGQLIQTISLLAGEGTKLASFLSSGWGIGVTVAASALVPLIAKLLETKEAQSDALEKMREDARQTELTRQAKIRFAETEEAVTQAINEQKDALDEQDNALKSEAQRAYEAAKANLQHEIAVRSSTKALLEQLIAQEELTKAYMRSPNAAKDGVTGSSLLQNDLDAIDRATAKLKQQDASIATARSNLARQQSHYSVELGKAMADPLEVIKKKYEGADGLIEQARKRAVAEGKVGDELQRQITLIQQQEARELEAARKASSAKATTSSGLSGREIGIDEARSIAQGAGFRVTSGYRTREEQQRLYDTVRTPENPVAKPGSSAHERGNALDIAFGSGVTPQSIRKAFNDEGVRLTKLLKETGHYHIEWSTAGTDKAASEAKREAAEQKRRADEKARQDRTIAIGSADTDLSATRIDIGDKRAAVQSDYQQELIDADQKRDLMRRLAQEEADAQFRAQDAKRKAYAGDVVAVQEVANQERLIRANLAAQLNDIERQHTADVQREQTRRSQAAERAAEKELQAKQRTIAQIEGYEDQLVSGIIRGRQSLGQIVGSIALQMAERSIAADLRYFTRKRLLTAQEMALEQARSRGGIVAHLLGETRKTAATSAGVAARAGIESTGFFGRLLSLLGIQLGVHTANEGVKTAATAAGASARAGAETGAGLAALAAEKAMTVARLGSYVALAGAGGVASMAAAPFPIDLGAPAFGAQMAATAASFGSLAAFDKGANVLPNDMIAQIHAGERIVPAADNREMMAIMRAGAGVSPAAGGEGRGRGAGGRGDTYHMHYSPTVHGQLPFGAQLAKHERNVMDMIQRGLRSGALRFS